MKFKPGDIAELKVHSHSYFIVKDVSVHNGEIISMHKVSGWYSAKYFEKVPEEQRDEVLAKMVEKAMGL